MATCTLIPIPKGKNNSGTDSVNNYRCIVLSSMFVKIFDLIFLNKFSDYLFTSTLQLGYIYVHHGAERNSHILHIGWWFYILHITRCDVDRVNYCKLFSKLMSRNIPTAYLHLLF